MKCLDCGNVSDFQVLYHDWSLLTREEDGSYSISHSLSFAEAIDPEHPTKCHNCGSTNIEETA
jgi:hypothetical protein